MLPAHSLPARRPRWFFRLASSGVTIWSGYACLGGGFLVLSNGGISSRLRAPDLRDWHAPAFAPVFCWKLDQSWPVRLEAGYPALQQRDAMAWSLVFHLEIRPEKHVRLESFFWRRLERTNSCNVYLGQGNVTGFKGLLISLGRQLGMRDLSSSRSSTYRVPVSGSVLRSAGSGGGGERFG